MLTNIVNRTQTIGDWQKIPWDDPDFSRRMLQEHLTQAHDAASRRTSIIEQQVGWIHAQVLANQPSNILDLGCGPGLYTERLARLGHRCTGIDFSPASIDYARQHSDCTYLQGDLREADFGSGCDLVLLIFGELNTFTADDAQLILDKAFNALKPGGALLLEPHTYEFVERIGHEPPSWYSAPSGLFSEQPYICLQESFFEAPCAVTRHYVIDAATGRTTTYGSSLRGYTEADYRHLLRRFEAVTFYPTLANDRELGNLCAIVARKPE